MNLSFILARRKISLKNFLKNNCLNSFIEVTDYCEKRKWTCSITAEDIEKAIAENNSVSTLTPQESVVEETPSLSMDWTEQVEDKEVVKTPQETKKPVRKRRSRRKTKAEKTSEE